MTVFLYKVPVIIRGKFIGKSLDQPELGHIKISLICCICFPFPGINIYLGFRQQLKFQVIPGKKILERCQLILHHIGESHIILSGFHTFYDLMGICCVNLIMKIIALMCFIIRYEDIRKPGAGMKAYTQAAFCKWLCLHFQFIYIFQDPLHMDICTLSFQCQLYALCMTDKQLGTHIVFHGTDHLAYI